MMLKCNLLMQYFVTERVIINNENEFKLSLRKFTAFSIAIIPSK